MPGAAVAVTKNGKVVYLKGFGSANLEYNIPITAKTVFNVGSMAMQFTGLAIAMLEKQGKLSLGDNIREYIPGLPDFGKTITIRHLLYHTSGIRDWPQALALAGWEMEDAITSEHILKMVKNQQGLDFQPGSEFLYCNTGYNLLAEIVRRITGKSFRDWTWENIFKPLGMPKTHFHDNSKEVVPNKAYSYSYDRAEGYLKSIENLAAPGSGSLYSTAGDLFKWLLNLESGRVGGADVIQKMCEKGTLKNGEKIDYGFGMQIGEFNGLKRFSCNSIWAEYGATLNYYPEQKLGVVVLCNISSNAAIMSERIANIYLEIPPKKKKSKVDIKKAVKVDQDIYNQYEGQYRLGPRPDYVITITNHGDRLLVEAPDDQEKLQILPVSKDEFSFRKGYGRMNFQRDVKGRVHQFTFLFGGVENQAKKIMATTMTPAKMREFTGKYYCKELDSRYNIVLKKEKLVVTHPRHRDIQLSLVDRDRFIGNKWFFYEVTFSRNAKQMVTGLNVSGKRPWYYRFEKKMGVGSSRRRDFTFKKIIPGKNDAL
jgi:CubicO group peptidase (beta-lactamase class C family)